MARVAAVPFGLLAAWFALARLQGDSEVVFGDDGLSGLAAQDGVWHGQIQLVNRGRQLAAIRRVEGRLLEGPPGRVLVTRQGSRPPEQGFWVSNLLRPGESCVADVDVEMEQAPSAPVVIEIDVHEIGRRLLVHRRARFELSSPARVRPTDDGPSCD